MPCKHDVHFGNNLPEAASPLRDDDQTSYLSLDYILQHLFIEAEIGHKLFQAPQLSHSHPGKLLFSAVEDLLGDSHFAGYFRNRSS
ncbi:hypothetical protein Pan241w_41320 [Gimesia alba]|uniref:Uncharacterized protein n=1 Tax=Gimesia alba TaxID=2527973 RepID=A0A517RJG3_9PLAN|nr:hypothetical protein Pan241w_41320 [Gimesia alba]